MIIIERESNNVLRIIGDIDSLVRFHDVFQTRIWPTWKSHLGKCKQLDVEQQYLTKSIPLGYILLNDLRDTHSGIEAAITDAKSIMTVIQ